jgi:hypothetical protein
MNYPVDTSEKYTLYNTATSEVVRERINYPRADGEQIVGGDPELVFLQVVSTDRPTPSDDKIVIRGDWAVDLVAETYTETWVEEDKPIVVPDQVTPRQLKLALIQDGSYETVKSIVDAQPVAVQVDWYDASFFERTNATLESLRQHPNINKTSEEVDELFVLAETL